VWIPRGVRNTHIQLSRLHIHVGVIHVGREGDLRPRVHVIVTFGEGYLKFENAIGEGTASDEDYSVEGSEAIKGGDEVDSSWCMLL